MILITGAGGNVGKEVLKQVVQTGVRVRAGFQSLRKPPEAPRRFETVVLDYNDPDTVRAALTGVDRVFLVGPPTEQLAALERKAVQVVAQSKVRLLVKLSAMGGRDATFPRQHAESEEFIKSSGMPYTFLRPNGFMQNLVNYSSPTIKTQNVFYGSEGDGHVSQVDIRDVAAVAVKALTEDDHVGRTYTLTGPGALTNTEIARILSDTLGREIRYIDLPPAQLKTALLSAGLPEWNADALLDLQRLYRAGKAATVTGDVAQILGREPISFGQFSRDYKAAFETRGQATNG